MKHISEGTVHLFQGSKLYCSSRFYRETMRYLDNNINLYGFQDKKSFSWSFRRFVAETLETSDFHSHGWALRLEFRKNRN
jgi:hypothetical protein